MGLSGSGCGQPLSWIRDQEFQKTLPVKTSKSDEQLVPGASFIYVQICIYLIPEKNNSPIEVRCYVLRLRFVLCTFTHKVDLVGQVNHLNFSTPTRLRDIMTKSFLSAKVLFLRKTHHVVLNF